MTVAGPWKGRSLVAEKRLVSIMMVRDALDGVADFPPPAGYHLRCYRSGDEAEWTTIWQASEPYLKVGPGLFAAEFGSDARALGERQFFLLDPTGRAVGTATAWTPGLEVADASYGRVHWVAVVPEMQGRGLAKCLMTAVMNRLRELGHAKAYLITQAPRVGAVGLYLKFGFVPRVRSDEERAAWHGLRDKLPGSALARVDFDI